MNLNIEKLENVKYRNSCIIARCPVCAEQGHDKKGQHLFIDEQGRFSCVIYPGEVGKEHRKRVFALVGIKSKKGESSFSAYNKIDVKKVKQNSGKVIRSNILGHLGRVFITHARKEEGDIKDSIYKKDFGKGIPNVPNEADCNNDNKVCARCGNQGKRFCFGEVGSGRFNYDFFCLDCRPYHF